MMTLLWIAAIYLSFGSIAFAVLCYSFWWHGILWESFRRYHFNWHTGKYDFVPTIIWNAFICLCAWPLIPIANVVDKPEDFVAKDYINSFDPVEYTRTVR